MEWSIPEYLQDLLRNIDAFIDRELKPIEKANPELFDHRREFTRTDVERGGIPTQRWRDILAQARRLSIEAGFYKYPFPAALGGSDGTISGWPSSASTWHAAGLGCTPNSHTRRRSSPTNRWPSCSTSTGRPSKSSSISSRS
jgi:hypothetical protein